MAGTLCTELPLSLMLLTTCTCTLVSPLLRVSSFQPHNLDRDGLGYARLSPISYSISYSARALKNEFLGFLTSDSGRAGVPLFFNMLEISGTGVESARVPVSFVLLLAV